MMQLDAVPEGGKTNVPDTGAQWPDFLFLNDLGKGQSFSRPRGSLGTPSPVNLSCGKQIRKSESLASGAATSLQHLSSSPDLALASSILCYPQDLFQFHVRSQLCHKLPNVPGRGVRQEGIVGLSKRGLSVP